MTRGQHDDRIRGRPPALLRRLERGNRRGPRQGVAAAFTEDATYTDPLADVRGHDGLAAAISGARQQFPGFEFKLTGTPDGHHDIVRFSWDLVSTADGSAPAAGSDVITLDDDGRISSVSGFLDRVPGA